MSFEVFILIFFKWDNFFFKGPQNFEHVMNLIFVIKQFDNGWKRWFLVLAFFSCMLFHNFCVFIVIFLTDVLVNSKKNKLHVPFSHHKIHGCDTSFIFYFWNLWRSVHYNKRCPCTPSNFARFWMNWDHWKSSEFNGLVNNN